MPGSSQPLCIMSGAASSKKKAKGGGGGGGGGKRAKTKTTALAVADDGPETPKVKKRKGDEELLQIDLKREQVVLRNTTVARLRFIVVISCYSSFLG